ncbi:SdrD B-like domain-containing protein [Pseudarcicella hirudinis]|uniref:SdrD B-like domain-containing protein n=1 Tax=Pseudarcicella hirudinis TaxID=1079859 RepID=UPI0035E6A824
MSTPALTDFRKCIKIITLIIISLFSGETHAQVSKISGMVFQDYNANGIKDGGEPSVSGVTVNVYDATGSVTGTANSAADGSYAITSSFTGPFKVVFSNIPSGFFPGFQGPEMVLLFNLLPETPELQIWESIIRRMITANLIRILLFLYM